MQSLVGVFISRLWWNKGVWRFGLIYSHNISFFERVHAVIVIHLYETDTRPFCILAEE